MTESHSFRIRRARLEDLETILLLWTSFMEFLTRKETSFSLKDDYCKEYRRVLPRKIEDRKTLVLLAEEEEAIGYCITSIRYPLPILEQRPFGQVSDLYLKEEYRGAGIGEALVDYSSKWLREEGIEEIHIKTFSWNTKGISFWKRQGFTPYELRLCRSL